MTRTMSCALFLSAALNSVESLSAFRREHTFKKGLIKNLAHIASSPTTGKKISKAKDSVFF